MSPAFNPIDDAKSRCCFYLLGELDEADRLRFETELGSSPELADELVCQADLLLAVADATTTARSIPVAAREQPVLRRAYVAVLLAVAACLLVAVVGVNQVHQNDAEELLIAQAWADNINSVIATSTQPVAEITVVEDDLSPLDSIAVDSVETDSFDWMFVAVSESSHGG